MPLTFTGYRSTDTDVSGSNANNIYAAPFTIKGSATQYDITISNNSDADILFGDGSGDTPTNASQVLQSTTEPGITTGNEIIYEAVVRFSGSDGETYTAIIFDYNEDGSSSGIDNNNSKGTNTNGLYEEGFFIAFISNDFDPASLPANVSPGPVPPTGVTLTRTSELLNNAQFDVFVCFGAGTQITLSDGLTKPVEKLCQGDLVMTADHGCQEVRWIGSRKLCKAQLSRKPELCPIRISAGALGAELPVTDLIVSPQHRILVRSKISERMFGEKEVLVAAKHLLDLPGIETVRELGEVTYYHILFDQHEIVFANGAETESLFTGPEALKSIGAAARQEIFELFPEIFEAVWSPTAARFLVGGRDGRRMSYRHKKNLKPLNSQAPI